MSLRVNFIVPPKTAAFALARTLLKESRRLQKQRCLLAKIETPGHPSALLFYAYSFSASTGSRIGIVANMAAICRASAAVKSFGIIRRAQTVGRSLRMQGISMKYIWGLDLGGSCSSSP